MGETAHLRWSFSHASRGLIKACPQGEQLAHGTTLGLPRRIIFPNSMSCHSCQPTWQSHSPPARPEMYQQASPSTGMLRHQGAGAWLEETDVSRVWQRPPLQQVAAKQVQHTELFVSVYHRIFAAWEMVCVSSALLTVITAQPWCMDSGRTYGITPASDSTQSAGAHTKYRKSCLANSMLALQALPRLLLLSRVTRRALSFVGRPSLIDI